MELSESIVLAGGFGTRLKEVVDDVPKPMAPVKGHPFLSYILNYLAGQRIERVILAVGYKAEIIMEYYGHTFRGMEIAYSIEENPLGTGGGILKACSKVRGDTTLVINGDTFFDVNLKKMASVFRKKEADLLAALKKMQDFDRYGTVHFDRDGRITGFEEKKPLAEGYINGGVYVLNKSIFSEFKSGSAFSFEQDVLEKAYASRPFYALPFNSYFIDIGIPEDYARAQREFKTLEK